MLDPLVLAVISIGFGLLFLLAAVHKLTGLQRFRAVLADYRVMPPVAAPLFAIALPVVEIVVGLSWLFSGRHSSVALATVGLLVLYTAAIALNLLRGRVHISCGCGFGKAGEGDDALSWGLVLRNLTLVAAALASLAPQASREMRVFDYFTLVVALLVIALLFAAANQLIRNAAAINSWRRPGRRHD